MSTVLATAVAAGFVWSVLLFFAAVFIRARSQEAGFGWALAGAALFAIVFCDRLPGSPTSLRDAIQILPGVTDGSELFTSSLTALAILFVVYILRIAVFYQLFLKDLDATDTNAEDTVNDVVAPTLSYVCFAVCAVALLQPAYEFNVLGTTLVSLLLVAGYYWRIVERFFSYLDDLGTLIVVATARIRRATNRFIMWVILRIVVLEERRRDTAPGTISTWARQQYATLQREELEARRKEKEKLAEMAERSSGRRKKAKEDDSE